MMKISDKIIILISLIITIVFGGCLTNKLHEKPRTAQRDWMEKVYQLHEAVSMWCMYQNMSADSIETITGKIFKQIGKKRKAADILNEQEKNINLLLKYRKASHKKKQEVYATWYLNQKKALNTIRKALGKPLIMHDNLDLKSIINIQKEEMLEVDQKNQQLESHLTK